jgi:Domain of unknown function (DUF4386)
VTPSRKISLAAGVLFLITFITSIPALALYQPVLDDPVGYIAGAGADNRIFLGAFLELLLVIANIGTAVVLFPILRRQDEILALGYVAARVVESAFILVGILAVLSVVTLREKPPGGDASALGSIAYTLAAIKDWTFLLGPGFVVGIGNGLLLGYLMYRSVLVPRPLAVFGLIGGPSHLRLGNPRHVRRPRRRWHGAGHRDRPGVHLGAGAWYLPHREGIQGLPDHLGVRP